MKGFPIKLVNATTNGLLDIMATDAGINAIPDLAGCYIAVLFWGYAVLSIAGLMHTDRPLVLSKITLIGAVILWLSVLVRVAPDFGLDISGPQH